MRATGSVLASIFTAASVIVLGATVVGPGCQTRCYNQFDCGPNAYCSASGQCESDCFIDQDCQRPPECQANPIACVPKGLRCSSVGRCVGVATPPVGGPGREVPVGAPPVTIEGWHETPGSGRVFVANRLAIAGKDRGFDIDNVCDPTHGCVDNRLWELGELGNAQIQSGLVGGESVLLIELAGLDEPYAGDDESLTVKIYGGHDADDPYNPSNNFRIPAGESACCEFTISPQSLDSPVPQARARAPAKIERGRLRSLAPVRISFVLTIGSAPHPEVRIERALVGFRLASDLLRLNEGLVGGAIPINTLAETDNPYCRAGNPSCQARLGNSKLIDLVSTLIGPRPDIDIDLDGAECLYDTNGDGAIDLCCDGAGAAPCDPNGFCGARDRVAPLQPDKPWTCALSPDVADGYSVGITFTAVAASIVGVGQ